MESEMCEVNWSDMHKNQYDSEQKILITFKEDTFDMLLNLRIEGRKG
jgi:hypothetical protein